MTKEETLKVMQKRESKREREEGYTLFFLYLSYLCSTLQIMGLEQFDEWENLVLEFCY